MSEREYGAGGWAGVGAPQANPTVEMEMRRFLPDDIEPLTARMTSPADTSDGRLLDYIEQLETTLQSFDVLPLDVFGFACTGSSYLAGRDRQNAIVDAATARFGYPVITAADAITTAMQALGAQRIAVLAPYPAHLIEAGVAYWESVGLSVVAVRQIDIGSADTRNIYSLKSADALKALDGFDIGDAEALVMSGTGMPSVNALTPAAARYGVPAVSSNGCLAWAMQRAIGREANLS
jgi:maleate isomerase